MINNKILGLIGFAVKARNICFGSDSVEERTNKNKVKLLIVAEDASERTKDKFIKLSKERNVPIIVGGNIEMLSKAIGKNNKAIIGIENVNLSNEIQKINNGGGTIG